MKFAEIVKWAGFEAADFPKASEILTHYYDSDKESEATEIHFGNHLFSKNDKSKEKFSSLLNKIETEITEIGISEITVKVDEFSILVAMPHLTLPYVFTRIPSLEFE